MKKLLLLIIVFISYVAIAQENERVTINGKIIVEGNDIEGITVFNSTSRKGTATNEKGEFLIAVTLNDILEFRAIEYENFDVKINKAILESKTLSVFLIEEINKLDEVIVTKRTLTGNINADVKLAKTFSPKGDIIYFGTNAKDPLITSDANGRTVENVAVQNQGQNMVHGLNVVNIVDQLLIPLFRSEVPDKKIAGIPDVPSKSIKYYFASNFLTENFKIPEYRVEEFIRYIEDETFDYDLLNYGRELEFLEVISEKSKAFLYMKKSTE